MKKITPSKKDIEEYMKEDMGLARAILEAFSKLYIYDKHLIINKPKDIDNEDIGFHHVGERSIVFRFAFYLQQILYDRNIYCDYNLDCEYNRNGSKPKYIQELGKNVYPDLIIHKRGKNSTKKETRNNLLVMEFKTHWNKSQKDDIKKIKAFINEQNGYNYTYGIAVLIDINKVELKMYDKVENEFFYCQDFL